MTLKIQKSPSNSRLHGQLEAFHEAQETLEDVGEVDQEPLEAHEVRETPLDTKIDRSKARKHRRLKKNFARRRNDLPTTTGKKNEQSHRSPVQERLHGCNGGQEKTPGDTWRSQKTIGGRKSIEKSSPGRKILQLFGKSS